jgi:ketosteroid isomerase-like protein
MLGAAFSACGSGERAKSVASADKRDPNVRSSAVSSAARHAGYLSSDKDKDNDDGVPSNRKSEKTDTLVPRLYGREANAADKLAVTAVVKHYYAAAAKGDGATACSLLDRTLATGLGESRGDRVACADVIASYFKDQHEQLAADEVSTMTVLDVRVDGNEGIATVAFRNAPSGRILVRREEDAWKVNALLDTEPS